MGTEKELYEGCLLALLCHSDRHWGDQYCHRLLVNLLHNVIYRLLWKDGRELPQSAQKHLDIYFMLKVHKYI